MALTQEQTIKINNWKAQHNNLLGNIKIENEQLEDILNRKFVVSKQKEKKEESP